ncbi:hypothetical protein [Winogradskyella sp.]|uniref:hypothetical protein n=1 Tax=Winogradskyella sp. TaxID=1883156 RepID=UPI0026113851|nr:hypothetical protein [Winogradskyella sp.]
MKRTLNNFPLLLTKEHLCEIFGKSRMTEVYRKILTEKVITNELGFSSIEEFKKIKEFTLEQSQNIKQYLKTLGYEFN